MNGINFLAQRNQASGAHRRFYLVLAATAAGAFAVILAWASHITDQTAQQQQLLNLLRTEHARLDAAINVGKQQEAQIAELERKRRHLEALQQQRNDAPRLLDELSRRTPPEVFLTALVQQGRNFTLSGSAPSHRHVMQLLEALRNAGGAFTQIELQEARSATSVSPAATTTRTATAPGPRQDFTITARHRALVTQ